MICSYCLTGQGAASQPSWRLAELQTHACKEKRSLWAGLASVFSLEYCLKIHITIWGKKIKQSFLCAQKRFELSAMTRLKYSFFLSMLVSRCHMFKRWHPLNTDMFHAMIFSICLYLKYASTFTPPHLVLTIPLLPQIKLLPVLHAVSIIFFLKYTKIMIIFWDKH